MSIPTFNDGATLRDVREKTINPMVYMVNEHEAELAEKSVQIAQNAAKSIANAEAIAKLTQDIVGGGVKCIVNTRMYEVNTTGNLVQIDATGVDPDEYPVRAAVFGKNGDRDAFHPCSFVEIERSSDLIVADASTFSGDVKIFVEFWKAV